MEKILSSKGKTLIVLNNFKYRLDKRLKSSEDRWRCSEKTCGSVLFTCEDGNVISRVVKEHNHEPCAEKALDRQRVNSAVKKKVVENMNAELIHREIAEQEASLSSLTKQDIMTLIRKSVRKTQQKALPKLPESSAENPKPNRRKQPLSVEPSLEDGLKSAQRTHPEERLAESGNELVSEPGPSSQVHPFTFVDVVCADDESLKRIKQEVPDSEDEDLLSNVRVKMELDEEEYDLHISDVISLSADSSIPNTKLADNDDVNTKFGEHVAETLRALTHDSSREKLKMLINNAIQVVIKSDQLLSKS